MFNHTFCPVCKGQQFKHFISCTDFTVSKQKFNIVECATCSFKFTNPIPEIKDLGDYYKSEDYISHSNTKKGLISKLYHIVRNYSTRNKLNIVGQYSNKGTILDYGCGTGFFLGYCKKSGWDCFGLEPDGGAREICKQNDVTAAADKQELKAKIADKSLSAITLWHVLEHVTDLEETLAFFKSKLSENGTLVIAVPNYRSFDAEYYKEFWAAYDVPRHLYHFDKLSLARLMNDRGFKLIKTLPMKFDSYYVSLLSERYKTGSTGYLNAFKAGFVSNNKASTNGEYSSLIYVFKHN